MKLYLIVCYVAAAILVAQAYKSEDINAWYEEAKEALEMMEDQGELQNLEDKGNSSQPGPTPTGNPHGCDCKGECKKLHHSRVPYKEEAQKLNHPVLLYLNGHNPQANQQDKHNYLSYESYPVLCRDAAAIMLPSGAKNPKKYICKQTFDCCRKCNHLFYVCLKESNQSYGFCVRAAYKCMCNCIEKRSYNELPYKPSQP